MKYYNRNHSGCFFSDYLLTSQHRSGVTCMDKSAHNDKTETLNSNRVAHIEQGMYSICQLLLHNYGHLLFSDVTEGVSVNRAATAACLSVAHRFTPGGELS